MIQPAGGGGVVAGQAGEGLAGLGHFGERGEGDPWSAGLRVGRCAVRTVGGTGTLGR